MVLELSFIFIGFGQKSFSWLWKFLCFGLTSVRINDRDRFIHVSFYVITFWIISSIIIVITFSNFVRILLELRELKRYHLHLANELNTDAVVRRDKPLNRAGEERTAKSLILVYFIQFSCVFVSYLMYYIQIIRNFALPPEKEDDPDFQIYFVVVMIINFFPCLNPIFLILCNKRLHMRVKELFKCTVNPEVEASLVHILTNRPKPMKTESTRALLDLKMNKIISTTYQRWKWVP